MASGITPGALVAVRGAPRGLYPGAWQVETAHLDGVLCSPPPELRARFALGADDLAPELLFAPAELELLRPAAPPPTLPRCAWPGCTRAGTLSTGTQGGEPYYCREHFEVASDGR